MNNIKFALTCFGDFKHASCFSKIVTSHGKNNCFHIPPKHLGIIGAGVIGLELGISVYSAALRGEAVPLALALLAWGVMAAAFLPILRLYRQPSLFALALPLAGLLYNLMTVDSALAYWRGRGGLRCPVGG